MLGGITALKTLDDLLAHTEKAAEVVEGDSVDLKSHVEAISSVVSAIELAPRAFSPDTLTSVASDIEATSSTIRQYLTSLNYVVREISTAAYTFREDYDQYGTEPYNEFLAITARIHNRNDDIARSAVLIRSMLGVLTIKSDVMENVIETNI